jgi:hypothetical protein
MHWLFENIASVAPIYKVLAEDPALYWIESVYLDKGSNQQSRCQHPINRFSVVLEKHQTLRVNLRWVWWYILAFSVTVPLLGSLLLWKAVFGIYHSSPSAQMPVVYGVLSLVVCLVSFFLALYTFSYKRFELMSLIERIGAVDIEHSWDTIEFIGNLEAFATWVTEMTTKKPIIPPKEEPLCHAKLPEALTLLKANGTEIKSRSVPANLHFLCTSYLDMLAYEIKLEEWMIKNKPENRRGLDVHSLRIRCESRVCVANIFGTDTRSVNELYVKASTAVNNVVAAQSFATKPEAVPA